MRIISGLFKGKKILEPKDLKTRPLKDLTKESIFNIIEHSNKFTVKLKNAYILDLFSGVGSFGIECLSRGAKKVVFFENYSGVLPILKKNLLDLNSTDSYEIIEKNLYNVGVLDLNIKFDIIFLDPPFKDKNFDTLIENISKSKILNKNGVIILHRHKNENSIIIKKFKIVDEKKYGISRIFFMLRSN